ncbi:hypothetical protein FB45DRAFT_973893 [Roridomyces roridus]|uniref:Uncharacterized protein n=1 Tax=Roridomyces roridus TaxID=1738132 RepID=A0AAD7F807_9AGAR|nr:hypothetical protein FB45DRAFT_973893 [Roridomyces roridus]
MRTHMLAFPFRSVVPVSTPSPRTVGRAARPCTGISLNAVLFFRGSSGAKRLARILTQAPRSHERSSRHESHCGGGPLIAQRGARAHTLTYFDLDVKWSEPRPREEWRRATYPAKNSIRQCIRPFTYTPPTNYSASNDFRSVPSMLSLWTPPRMHTRLECPTDSVKCPVERDTPPKYHSPLGP